MSITPTAIIRSVSPRPYAGVHAMLSSVSTHAAASLQDALFGGEWVCVDHMSTEHNPTTGNPTTGNPNTESKRLTPGSFAGVLT